MLSLLLKLGSGFFQSLGQWLKVSRLSFIDSLNFFTFLLKYLLKSLDCLFLVLASFVLCFNEFFLHTFSWSFRSWSIFFTVKIYQSLTFLHFRNRSLNKFPFFFLFKIVCIFLCMDDWLIKFSSYLTLLLSFHLFSTILSLSQFLNSCFMKLLTSS